MFKFFAKTDVEYFKCKIGEIRGKIIKRGTRFYFKIKDKENNVSFNSINDTEENRNGGFYKTYKECFCAMKECWEKCFNSYPFD